MVRIPWYPWCAALAVTSAYVGGYWEISWHRSIGRDGLDVRIISPPHMVLAAGLPWRSHTLVAAGLRREVVSYCYCFFILMSFQPSDQASTDDAE